MGNITDDQDQVGSGGSSAATATAAIEKDSQKLITTINGEVDEEDPLPSIVMCDKLLKITGQVRPKHHHSSQSQSGMKRQEKDMFELHFRFN